MAASSSSSLASLQVAGNSPEDCDFWKEGSKVKSWKKRYFVLASDTLHYFTSAKKAAAFRQNGSSSHVASSAAGSIILTNCVIWNGHPESRDRAAGRVKGSKAENYFEIVTTSRRFRLMAKNEGQKRVWKTALLQNRFSREPWASRFPDYASVRNNVLEGHMVQLDGAKKTKTRNVVATLFYMFLFRTITDAEPRYVLTMENCEVEKMMEKKELVVSDSAHREPFVFSLEDSDLLEKWDDFLKRTVESTRQIRQLRSNRALDLTKESGVASPSHVEEREEARSPSLPSTPANGGHARSGSSSSSSSENLSSSDSSSSEDEVEEEEHKEREEEHQAEHHEHQQEEERHHDAPKEEEEEDHHSSSSSSSSSSSASSHKDDEEEVQEAAAHSLPPPPPPAVAEEEKGEKDEDLDRWQAFYDQLASHGVDLVKHGRRGKPHERHISVNVKTQELQWMQRGKPKTRNAIPVNSIKEITVGIKTAVLQKRGKESTCFSIIGDRSLDLQCLDQASRDEWVEKFSVLARIGTGELRLTDGGTRLERA